MQAPVRIFFQSVFVDLQLDEHDLLETEVFLLDSPVSKLIEMIPRWTCNLLMGVCGGAAAHVDARNYTEACRHAYQRRRGRKNHPDLVRVSDQSRTRFATWMVRRLTLQQQPAAALPRGQWPGRGQLQPHAISEFLIRSESYSQTAGHMSTW
jgi:hypothetical protein